MTLTAANAYSAASSIPPRSTGKERDQESGLDYFGARYYGSSMGRFLTPDWSKNPQGVPYADFTNPQSLNLYSYMRNNPLSGTDPDGHCCLWVDMNRWMSDPSSLGTQLENIGIGLLKTGANLLNMVQSDHVLSASVQAPMLQPSNAAQAATMLMAPLAIPAMGAEAAAALETESSTLTTTLTSEGDTFTHYGYMADQANFASGLQPGAFATTAPDLTGSEAQSTLALPDRIQGPPDAAYPVSPEPGTPISGPSTVQPQYGQPGGGQEVSFPQGTGPGTVGPPNPLYPWEQ